MTPWVWRLAHSSSSHSSSDMDRRGRINTTNSSVVDPDHTDNQISQRARKWYVSNGGSSRISLFTRCGFRKGINQDTMLAWERFGYEEGTIFCGVFDGHGKHGHQVSRNVRDKLPIILANCWTNMQPPANSMFFSTSGASEADIVGAHSHRQGSSDDPAHVIAWKESFLVAFKQMDRELLRGDFDSHSSGTTAVALVKQGNDLIVGNVGDSRAVLGTRVDDNSMRALQLTVDLIPNVPREAERIKRHKGRVFPLPNEPSVHRVWLPNKTTPGLAMARTFGDYCLKKYGVISEPEVTIRRLSKKDEFVVLATDGVWNVLTNQEVVDIVASTSDRSYAAEAVVDKAMGAWKTKSTTSMSDDCAVVCLFI